MNLWCDCRNKDLSPLTHLKWVITLCSMMPLVVDPLPPLPPKPPGLIAVTMLIICKCSSSNIFPVSWIVSTNCDASSLTLLLGVELVVLDVVHYFSCAYKRAGQLRVATPGFSYMAEAAIGACSSKSGWTSAAPTARHLDHREARLLDIPF
jgi:hypothetical protein